MDFPVEGASPGSQDSTESYKSWSICWRSRVQKSEWKVFFPVFSSEKKTQPTVEFSLKIPLRSPPVRIGLPRSYHSRVRRGQRVRTRHIHLGAFFLHHLSQIRHRSSTSKSTFALRWNGQINRLPALRSHGCSSRCL